MYELVRKMVKHKNFNIILIKIYICIGILFLAYAYNFCSEDYKSMFDCICFAVGIVSMASGGYIAFDIVKKYDKKN